MDTIAKTIDPLKVNQLYSKCMACVEGKRFNLAQA